MCWPGLAGYSGLCVLIDEAESYSLLAKYQQPKASLFFSAVIYAALRGSQSRISQNDLPQHRWREYPVAYRTRPVALLPLHRHPQRQPPAPGRLAGRRSDLRSGPQSHAPGDRPIFAAGHGLSRPGLWLRTGRAPRPNPPGAAEHLALGMRNDKLSIRGIVRLAVELYDLLYLHPEYDTATLLDELREQMR